LPRRFPWHVDNPHDKHGLGDGVKNLHCRRMRKLLLDDLDHAIGWRTGWEKPQIFSIAADQLDKSRVVDRVGLAVLACDLGVIDLIGEGKLTDVVLRSGQPDEARVKGRHVVA